MQWTRVLPLTTSVLLCACSSSQPAQGGDAGDDAPADATPDAPPAMIESGTWMISDVTRVPDAGTCWATLFHLDVARDHVAIGARKLGCGSTTDTISELDLTVSGGSLLASGTAVGTIGPQLLDVTFPGGAGSLHIDVSGAAPAYREAVTALGATTTFTGTLQKMPDERPIALASAESGTEDVQLAGTLHAAQLPTATVTFALATAPALGTATIDPSGSFTYRGNTNANGGDAFAFSVSDGTNPTTTAQVAIQLAAVEDPPVATSQAASVVEDTPTPIALSASDPDNDPLTVTVTRQPAHGTLAVTGLTATYTPAQDYNGSDSFAYEVYDAQLWSSVATVSITVTPVDDAPIATPQTVNATGTNRTAIQLAATDVDSTGLTYAISTQPTHGTLTGSPPSVLYRANAGFTGDDAFQFTANDGTLTSAPATVTVHVLAPTYGTTTLASGYAYSPGLVYNSSASSTLYYAVAPFTGATSLYATDGTTTHLVLSETGNIATGAAFSLGTSDFLVFGTSSGFELHALADGSLLHTIASPDPTTYTQGGTLGRPSLSGSTAFIPVFWSSTTQQLAEIWATDGTAANTRRLYQIGPISGTHAGSWDINGVEYVWSGGDLLQLTATSAPAKVASLPAGATVGWGYPVGGVVWFAVNQSTGCTNGCDPTRELYRTDGTTAGTVHVATIDSGFISYGLYYPTGFNNQLYFGNNRDLFKADPTSGVTAIGPFPTNSWSGTSLSSLGAPLDKLVFWNRDEPYPTPGYFYQLYTYDGTTTTQLYQWPNNGTYIPGQPTGFDGLAFFLVHDSTLASTVLWRTDDTASGTRLEVDTSATAILGVVGGRLLLATATGVTAVAHL